MALDLGQGSRAFVFSSLKNLLKRAGFYLSPSPSFPAAKDLSCSLTVFPLLAETTGG